MEPLISNGNANSGLKSNGRLGAGSQKTAYDELVQPLLVKVPVILAAAVPAATHLVLCLVVKSL